MQRRFVVRFLFALQLVVAIGCVQLSGYAHLVTDALVAAGVLAPHSDDCSDENDDRPCPPGCPTCHSAHCAAPALPAPRRTAELVPGPFAMVSPLDSRRRVPASPEPRHVFRPPRLRSLA